MKTVEQKFRTIDDLIIQIGNYLIRNDKSIPINKVFDNLFHEICNIEVGKKYKEEKQNRTEHLSKIWNNSKPSMNETNPLNYDIYTGLLEYLVEIYMWLIEVKTST